MAPLPFAASFEALAFIVRELRLAGAHPACAALVPALHVCFNSCTWEDATKRIIEHIPFEHYRVGWYMPEKIADAVEIEILGRRLFVEPDTLTRLAGSRLVLRSLDRRPSKASGDERRVLVAVPFAAATS